MPGELTDAQHKDALISAQKHLDLARIHTSTAEQSYYQILKTYERLSETNPQTPESQVLQEAMGDHAEQIAHDVNQKHIFDAGEEYVHTRVALKEAGLGNIANRITRKCSAILHIKQTRDALSHPEQPQAPRLNESEFPEAAAKASTYLDTVLKETREAEVPADKQGAKDEAIRYLEHMKNSLEPIRNGLVKPTELTQADVRTAVEMQEINAGSHVAATKDLMKQAGYTFDEYTFPGASSPIDVMPNHEPGSHPLDILHTRRDDLSHLDPKPEHPGALERAEKNIQIAGQLPEHATSVGRPPAAPESISFTSPLHPTVQESLSHSNTPSPPSAGAVEPHEFIEIHGGAHGGGPLAAAAFAAIGAGTVLLNGGSARAATIEGAKNLAGAIPGAGGAMEAAQGHSHEAFVRNAVDITTVGAEGALAVVGGTAGSIVPFAGTAAGVATGIGMGTVMGMVTDEVLRDWDRHVLGFKDVNPSLGEQTAVAAAHAASGAFHSIKHLIFGGEEVTHGATPSPTVAPASHQQRSNSGQVVS